ncbi:restriction endonuclease subunit S [Thalassolituus oleivorans]|uniref:Type I restriction-modification system specificity subunit n=1 Tax=Thalassolituus oleivorans MIL-1 TaxID=1298593 RepID=M5DQI6_9GAMM|nr:restriction endonuclease subunit S [Thalassolituus oleivorans]PHQ83396.1 MAG: restriction endonuclease subunit S [Thalassobium sp.]PHQ87017.1 MAG: restriction endonuclease subunit S [Thalassobium sp.]CCU71417.1 type I restriction-modification system specificity subunit [Thalassolituus oleivorans MIL-1]
MVPKGWSKVRLGSVAELQRGFDLPSSQRIDGSVPIVSSGGVTGYHSEAKSKAPGVVTGRYGSIGDVFYLEEDYWPLNTSLWVKDFHGNHEKFVYYLLCNFDFKKFSDKTGVPGVNRNDLHAVRVKLPAIPEQKKIAQILSTWDKAITTTEQLLANSQQQKKALMQQLLTGKKRLLDENGVRFSGEFKRFHFSDLLNIDQKSLGAKTDPDLKFDYISLSDVGTGTISRAIERHTFKTSPSRARRIVSSGDILLATVRPNLQGFAKVKEQHKHCIASTGFAVLSPKKGTCNDYIYHYLFGSHITGQINALVVGTNYPAINSSDVSGLCIYCPNYEEQVQIAKVLNSSDELVYALQQKLDALKQEKKALMQQLLTGKRRVKIQ